MKNMQGRYKILSSFTTFPFINQCNLVSTCHTAMTYLNLLVFKIKFKSYKALTSLIRINYSTYRYTCTHALQQRLYLVMKHGKHFLEDEEQEKDTHYQLFYLSL